ncbi:MAG: sodium:proton exchanger [Candidatus Magasanikbacteria bacterium RIFCSPHIGHO2_01_FULL_33_34]|uniref:Sodium:proton exchanger n=1 Tax=Candidatus Magasanikbacteria bacterium RIFCSPHIGHO2_01_FULL_33_34 TaxID=1798671 RepID=A0A1F6LGT4_9BACT|nr:MAG: sodium:proton exchanger [Candidatus Magasanikbacteria bacterium RIFCSPHIGHO2_01_FULL_33_34]OGH66127.1 MAG: sodium:proton exchanger [Candidatus Magasanikbacteria bacterium RIFCSPHIGHO2_02_FULL_33_17]OGH75973.1 MAG: sodium:proton exchanger [Candidatus Magasanikbacteria bacterium RIFCSPLOWO2_01_FULL_33_34]OGH81976.1 MAG: sodium:proton exchanger [Candidatus Magasanikbacteria bacterium RIFCSPLOWO2_12_FULL_34_7]
MLIPIILIIIGLTILIIGGELVVRGSASIAKKLGVKPIVIGLTVVAFGTSAPELVVNIFSALRGTPDIAIGNVVGSNIANILLILGICALIRPLKVSIGTVWKEVPLALLAVILILFLGNDAFTDGMNFNLLSRTDGFALIAFFIIFLYYTFGISKVENKGSEEIAKYSWTISILLTLLGFAGLVLGGKLLIDNAIILATIAGMSEALIGLTIVAIGTSLPELVTSLIAVRHGHDDIAIGNIVGSNIFNIFWILGLTATLLPLPFNPAVNLDIAINIFATLLLFIFMFIHSRHKLNRWQGGLMLLSYIAYIIYLIYRG